MPDRPSNSRTHDLERFIRQFFVWYHMMFHDLKDVQRLFDVLFEKLCREEGTRYGASYADWAGCSRRWNVTWNISKRARQNARHAGMPPTIPKELLEFEIFSDIILEGLPQTCKIIDVQEGYVPCKTNLMPAVTSCGQPTNITFDQPVESAEPITSNACCHSDPGQGPLDTHIGCARSVQTSRPPATPDILGRHGSLRTSQKVGDSQYPSAGSEESTDLLWLQEPRQYPVDGRHLERYPSWISWNIGDVAAAN